MKNVQVGPQVGLYIMNAKGLAVLRSLLSEFGATCLSFVVCADDPATTDNSMVDIEALCAEQGVLCIPRQGLHNDSSARKVISEFSGWRMAVGWRWMIPSTHQLIVFHDSLLPRYRGFAPLVNALINGDNEIGVTALHASEAYDCGDVIGQLAAEVSYPLRIVDAIEYVSTLYSRLAVDIVGRIRAGQSLPRQAQNEANASYSLWLDEADYAIDWSWPAAKVQRFIDATSEPFAGAKCKVQGEWIRVYSAEVVTDVKVEHRARHLGKIVFLSDHQPVVVCGQGLLKLTRLSAPTTAFRTRFY